MYRIAFFDFGFYEEILYKTNFTFYKEKADIWETRNFYV
jgi:hypothetical protein